MRRTAKLVMPLLSHSIPLFRQVVKGRLRRPDFSSLPWRGTTVQYGKEQPEAPVKERPTILDNAVKNIIMSLSP